MGLPLAIVFADYGFRVIGVGKNPQNINKLNKGISTVTGEKDLDKLLKTVVTKRSFFATTDGIDASKKSDVKVIIIPTFLTYDNKPDLSIVKEVIASIGKGLNKGDIVILESTAPPGTTIEYIAPLLEKISGFKLNKDFSVAHCPERTNSGTAISDIKGRLNPKIIGASDKISSEILRWLYGKINKRGVIIVSNPTIAEMVKVSEGMYRDLNIAFANNLYLVCRELGIDAYEVIKAANTDAVCNILTPGPGVGGHCIPVYPYFILSKIKKNKQLILLGRKINDDMSKHIISLAEKSLIEKGKKMESSNILILGLVYRGGAKELRKSPGLKIATELKSRVNKLFIFDPLFTAREINNLGFSFSSNFQNVDCIIITTEQEEFKQLNWQEIAKKVKTKIVIDTKNIINKQALEDLGFSIKRIGYAE